MKKRNKNNIVEELITELTSDAGSSMFGGAKYGGAGSFAHGSQVGAKSWGGGSPRNRGTTTAPRADELTGIVSAEEEEAHHAPKRKPFPLETIDDSLISAYIVLGNAVSQMKNCLRYNAYINTKKNKKASLKFLHDKVVGMREMIKRISEDLDKINLSN
jgi:hypothetical protein